MHAAYLGTAQQIQKPFVEIEFSVVRKQLTGHNVPLPNRRVLQARREQHMGSAPVGKTQPMT